MVISDYISIYYFNTKLQLHVIESSDTNYKFLHKKQLFNIVFYPWRLIISQYLTFGTLAGALLWKRIMKVSEIPISSQAQNSIFSKNLCNMKRKKVFLKNKD